MPAAVARRAARGQQRASSVLAPLRRRRGAVCSAHRPSLRHVALEEKRRARSGFTLDARNPTIFRRGLTRPKGSFDDLPPLTLL